MTHSLLVVDDDEIQLHVTRQLLLKSGYQVLVAGNGEAALRMLETNPVDLILLDLYMPQMDGRRTLTHIHQLYPSVPVIILTVSNEIEDAVELLKMGACDYLNKPASMARLKLSIEQHIKIRELNTEVSRLRRQEKGQGRFADLIGDSGGLAGCIAMARKATASDIPVLITGESGVGKELLARAIHGEGHRSGKPFVAINCGAIPENLMESLLFGHEKGAFTGAIAREIGKFREAEGGTLFLDEVAELKMDMQTKLLRVLQEKEIQPVGGAKPVRVNVRIISATHHNLIESLAKGVFREDLYYRLNVMPINMPRLRDRKMDIPELVQHILSRFCAVENKFQMTVNDAALKWLMEQPWVGNVRELENLLYQMVVLHDKAILSEQDFTEIKDSQRQVTPAVPALDSVLLCNEKGIPKTLEAIEMEVIKRTLERCHNHIPEAAGLLGIGQSTLYKKLKNW